MNKKRQAGNVRTGKKARKRDIERSYSRSQFVAKLRRLALAVEKNRPFTIRVAGETLRIPADAIWSIEHEREGRLQELEFQIRWKSR